MIRPVVLLLLLGEFSLGQNAVRTKVTTLYEAKNWIELYRALQGTRSNDFYRGVASVVFHQDSGRAETLLQSAIQTSPKSQEAYQAYEWLSHLFLYTGQYRRAVSAMEARWAAFPGKRERTHEQAEIAAFRGLPDQVAERVQASTLPHERRSIFVPVSVNGVPETFFFDTGAWVSATSESEAKRLGLRFTDATGAVGTMTNRAAFRTAVANTVTVGNVQLANVAFFVFPDADEPWSVLPRGRKGLLGMPVILAFRTLRWTREGVLRIGDKPAPFDVDRSNLVFDNDHLVLRAGFQGRTILATVDTGAETTDLYREFGVHFPSTLALGVKSSTEVRGNGGAESYESVILPEVTFDIAGRRATLHNTDVLVNRVAQPYVGNFGMDLFQQADAFKLDFSAMRFEFENSH